MSMFRMAQPMYDPEDVRPMREELVAVGIEELHTAESVDAAFDQAGTSFFIINSVCGCAAGGARPGVALALQNGKIPDRLYTVFAGMDKEAVARLRERITGFPPSSPSAWLVKDGKVVFALQRMDVEGFSPDQIAARLMSAFDEHCVRTGPSVDSEKFAGLNFIKACGSQLAAKARAKYGAV